MMRRRSRVIVQAFSRLFGRGRETAEAGSLAEAAQPPALAKLPGLPGETLVWSSVRRRRSAWRLQGADGTLAVLQPKGLGFVGRTSAGEWMLATDWRGRLRACRTGTAEPEVVFEPRLFTAGRLLRTGHEPLLWRQAGLAHWWLETEDGRRLAEARSRGLFRMASDVHLSEAARTLPDLDALVLLAGALPVIAQRSSSHAH